MRNGLQYLKYLWLSERQIKRLLVLKEVYLKYGYSTQRCIYIFFLI